MLIGSGRHGDVESPHALVAADHIGNDGRIGVSYVRKAVGVIQRRRQIVLWLGSRSAHSPFLMILCVDKPLKDGRRKAEAIGYRISIVNPDSKRGTWCCQIGLCSCVICGGAN